MKKALKNEEIGHYISYGVVMQQDKGEDICLHDVTSNQAIINHFIELLNHYQVSAAHFEDVFADFLCTGEILRFYPELAY
ncbi:hypothetical protein H8709_00540 [Oscillospiraceae bacterium NSJ-54]|uniref:Uncharacterized protein n=2 Tax=Zongyangia hominis TaxID=2763677 RepID=A0A926E8L2_9FIRM|nr:hypothetical protein [Zongyangia hominis]